MSINKGDKIASVKLLSYPQWGWNGQKAMSDLPNNCKKSTEQTKEESLVKNELFKRKRKKCDQTFLFSMESAPPHTVTAF